CRPTQPMVAAAIIQRAFKIRSIGMPVILERAKRLASPEVNCQMLRQPMIEAGEHVVSRRIGRRGVVIDPFISIIGHELGAPRQTITYLLSYCVFQTVLLRAH